ncbi:glycosyltransferase family 1 protein [Bradyrhizobium sp. SZCCHNPS1003]|uniref:glycosyltransferase family 4 protein n=1 Tax=Bradyrhizobium sp. SZCCHNPS1003 TaxID=3057330 RepID=UPI0028E6F272|nr:glycosyltransferase family 1 protein [Bradyrhizobium sp. SZCCHNPS1003]
MRVGIERAFLEGPRTGIANYAQHTICAIAALSPSTRFSAFGRLGWRELDTLHGLCTSRALHEVGKDGELHARHSRSRPLAQTLRSYSANLIVLRQARALARTLSQIAFIYSSRGKKLDLFHAFNFRPLADPGIPTLPVVYDLSTFRHPEFHPVDRVRWLSPLGKIIERAPCVQTISEFSKREIISYFGAPPDKIFVGPPAAAPIYSPLGEEFTARELSSLDLIYGNFFLSVGTLEPRKNLRTLIAAYSKLDLLSRTRFPLVIVGGPGWGNLRMPAEAEALTEEGSLRWLTSISNGVLRSLYEGARLLLMPSVYEGFGMPVVEALACGTAVAFSAGSAMEEAASGVGIAIDALDVDGWAEVLRRSLDSVDHADPIQRQQRVGRASEFSWVRSAQKVLLAYGAIASGRSRLS